MDRCVLRVGQVGVGGRGNGIMAGVLQSDNLELACIQDVDEKAVEKALQKHPCQVCSSFEEMLALDVDAVLLILPNFLHESFTVQAAEAGKHVFVEKPIANRLDEAGRMIAACRDHDVLLSVGHSDRHRGRCRVLAKLVQDGVLGDMCGFQACNSHDNAKRSDKHWKTDPEMTPCVPLMQLGIHQIDTLRSLFGDVASVFSHHAQMSDQFDMIDSTHSLIRFESGVTGSLACYYVVPGTKVLNLYGVGGRAIAHEDSIEVLKEGASEPEVIDGSGEDNPPGAVRMLSAFADAVLNGSEFPTDGMVGAKALAVLWAAVYSAELGREVTLEETLEHYGATYLMEI